MNAWYFIIPIGLALIAGAIVFFVASRKWAWAFGVGLTVLLVAGFVSAGIFYGWFNKPVAKTSPPVVEDYAVLMQVCVSGGRTFKVTSNGYECIPAASGQSYVPGTGGQQQPPALGGKITSVPAGQCNKC